MGLRVTGAEMLQQGPKITVQATRIVVTGSFPILPVVFSANGPPDGAADADATTDYGDIGFSCPLTGPLTMTYNLGGVGGNKPGILITFWNGTTRASSSVVDGTLGVHEDKHKAFALTWWTQDNLVKIAKANKMAFDNLSDNQAQANAIHQFMLDQHDFDQDSNIDTYRQPRSPAPTFGGTTY
jgi:hypothetical protein